MKTVITISEMTLRNGVNNIIIEPLFTTISMLKKRAATVYSMLSMHRANDNKIAVKNYMYK